MVFDRGIHRADVVLRRADPRDVSVGRHAGQLVDLAPVATRVVTHLDQAVVSAGIQQACLLRAFGEGRDVAVQRRGRILRDRIGSPDFPHHRQGVAVDLPREIRRDRLPAVAAIVGAIQHLRREIERCVRVGRDDEWRIPVPPGRRAALFFLRLDADALARPLVVADDDAVLELGVDRVRIFGIHVRHEASPPCVTNQSWFRMPWSDRVRDGPPSELLSCSPPYTL
jgi:hypothetical protein